MTHALGNIRHRQTFIRRNVSEEKVLRKRHLTMNQLLGQPLDEAALQDHDDVGESLNLFV
jgi:hypothetical protein